MHKPALFHVYTDQTLTTVRDISGMGSLFFSEHECNSSHSLVMFSVLFLNPNLPRNSTWRKEDGRWRKEDGNILHLWRKSVINFCELECFFRALLFGFWFLVCNFIFVELYFKIWGLSFVICRFRHFSVLSYPVLSVLRHYRFLAIKCHLL